MSTGNSQSGNASSSAESLLWGVEGKWLQKQLASVGASQADLARHLGLAPPVINKMIKGRRVIKAIEADKIRDFLFIRGAVTERTFPQGAAAFDRNVRESVIDANLTPPLRSEMPRDIPILGTVSGGAGALQMNGEAIDWARRPPRLKGRSDVFGLYVEDLSMIPAYRPGALILVERSRPPAVGDDIVLELHPERPGADQRALIKHLVALTPRTVRVMQHNPPTELEFPREQVIHLYRVMTMSDLLGA